MSKTGIVFFKELKEVMRDYRTLMMMIIIPTMFYPAMLVFPATFAKQSIAQMGKEQVQLGVVGYCEPLLAKLATDKQLKITRLNESEYEQQLKLKAIDAVIVLPKELDEVVGQAIAGSDRKEIKPIAIPKIKILFDTNREKVLFSMTNVYSALNSFQEDCVKKRLKGLDIGNLWERETNIKYNDVLPKASDLDDMLPQFAPYLMVLMVLLATSYPAIDLVTGERQRGTLALLLVAPVERRSIMYGKIAVVVLVGVLTTILGLISIGVTLQFGPVKESLADAVPRFDFSMGAGLQIFLVMLPLVVFISALTVYVSAWTRTFQQAQGYLFPLLLIVLFLASAAQVPDLASNKMLLYIPIANTTLCIKQILTRHQTFDSILITFATSAFAALLLAKSAGDLLEREDLLFGVNSSPRMKLLTGSYGRELIVFGSLVFLLLFYCGQLVMAWNAMLGLVITQICLILLPAIGFLLYTKAPIKDTLSLRMPKPRFLIGAALLGFTTVFLSLIILTIQAEYLPFSEEYAKQMMLMVMPPGRPLWQIILVAAVMPAICEELFFRGLLLGILRRNMTRQSLILTIGLLFGVFHLSMFRFLPTGLLGILLAFLTLISGSIFPSMILHFVHNGYYLWATYYKVDLTSTPCIMLAFVGMIIGALLIGWKSPVSVNESEKVKPT